MSVIVFLGPTLSVAIANQHFPEATFVSPAKAGDVRRSLDSSPVAIGIIDGFFEQVPSVRHKEILFALSRGVWVYGSSSMGALRAAELHTYGMIGVGAIFEAYRSGELTDDDEVAVSHAAADLEYRTLSDAMVNIRFGLRSAAAANVISRATSEALTERAKRQFYPERTWRGLLQEASGIGGVDPAELARMEAWLAREKPDQKRQDAITLLRTMAADHRRGYGRFVPEFAFEPTVFWERMDSAARVSGRLPSE